MFQLQKKLPLTQGQFALIDTEDFDRLNQYKWHAYKDGKTYYARHTFFIDGKWKNISLHRFILNAPKNKQVDHINFNGLDNRKENLRIVTNAQNKQNRLVQRNNKLGLKGVHRQENRYIPIIGSGGKGIYLGCYKTAEKAAEAYDKAALRLHGNFARLNLTGGVN